MFRWHVAAFAAVIALGGCATEGATSIVKSETGGGAGYRHWPMKGTTTAGTQLEYTIWLKPYNEAGSLGLCGYISMEGSSIEKQLVSAMFRDAALFLNDAALGKGWFLTVRDPNDKRASCVKTTTPWSPTFNGPLRLRTEGGYGRVFF